MTGLAIAGVLALTLGACGSSGSGESGSGTGTQSGGSAAPSGSSSESAGGTSSSSGSITIGYAGDFTGEMAQFDGAELAGAKVAVQEINGNGGVDGHKIKLISKDTGGKQQQAVRYTKELIDDGATFLFGTPGAPYNAEAAVACKAGVPITTGDLTPPTAVEDAGSCAYQLVFQDNQQAAVVAEKALEMGYKTAYILTSPDHPYLAQLPVYFAQTFKHGGGKIVGHDSFKMNAGDFTVQASKIASLDPQPDIVFTAMFGQDLPTFVKELRQAGVTSQYMTGEVLGDPSVLKIGPAIEGAIGTTHMWPHNDNAAAKFYKKFEDATGNKPESPVVGLGYNAVKMVAHIVKANGGDSSAKAIAKGLDHLDFNGLTGHLVMDPKTHKATMDITLIQVKNDQFKWLGVKTPKWVPAAITKN